METAQSNQYPGMPGQPQYQQPMPGMPGTTGQYGQPIPGAPVYQQPYPGQGMPAQPQYQAPQQPAKAPSTVVEVIRSNYTTIALFEVSGGYDPAQQYPKALCFVMGVPGIKDPSKQSGRRYVPANKIVMKFSTQEIRSLGQSLINIATFKQAATNFIKHSDPSKNSYSQAQAGQAGAAQAQAKKLEAKFDPAKTNIVITMNYGQNNVLVPVPLQDAYGLGHDLINIGNFSDVKLAEHKLLHKIGREEVAGIDYDPVGTEEVAQPQYAQPAPQYQAPAQQYAQPQGMPAAPQYQAPAQQYAQPAPQGMPAAPAQPQYTAEQLAYFQSQQAHAGYPGAQ